MVELLSPADNAAWYAAWMMAWVVFIIPIQIGMTSFAEIARAPERTAKLVSDGIRTSLALGAIAALGLAVLADPILSLLGDAYAAAAQTPLRILLVGFLPLTFILAYFSVCRARRRLGEAIALGTVDAVASIVVPALVAPATGLERHGHRLVGGPGRHRRHGRRPPAKPDPNLGLGRSGGRPGQLTVGRGRAIRARHGAASAAPRSGPLPTYSMSGRTIPRSMAGEPGRRV